MKQQCKSIPLTLSDNAGFTLLEIIAVLVILGILAVVAVPRYFNLQTQAREHAFETGVAEVRGRINGHFAQQVLSGVLPDAIVYSIATVAPASGGLVEGDLGDFTITAISGGTMPSTSISVTLAGKTGSPVSGMTETFTVPRPAAP